MRLVKNANTTNISNSRIQYSINVRYRVQSGLKYNIGRYILLTLVASYLLFNRA